VAQLLLKNFLVRFWFGIAGSLMAGLLIFRAAIVIPGMLAFQCISVGAVTAAIVSLVRLSRHGYAMTVVAVFGVLRLGLIESQGWMMGISGILLAGGIYLTAIIFDLLGRRGMMFGKFLILGPLIGGIYLALTPLVEFQALTANGVMWILMEHVLLGVVIGDGVGLGIEVAELLGRAQEKAGSS
jgi:hypothetical protein